MKPNHAGSSGNFSESHQNSHQQAAVLLSQSYAKALFTISYLVAFQMKKVLATYTTTTSADKQSSSANAPESADAALAMAKFNNFFKSSLITLTSLEVHGEEFDEGNQQAPPKYSVCFSELA